MPTWLTGLLKKMRSPGFMLSASTSWPSWAWAREVRGSSMPAFSNANCVRPEQSKPSGLVPPHT